MKHVNKPLGVNLNVLEQKSRDRKAITEGINIAILILLGCSGLYLYTSISSPKEPKIHFSNMTTNTVIYAEDEQSLTTTSEKSISKNGQLQIKGHKEAGEKVLMSFESFDNKAEYRIDFGDGETQAMTDKTISHVYDKPGSYKVQLVIRYNDQPLERVTKTINIDESIEVTTDAYIER